jgi:NADPH:quinone reductase-like Zn-dependent oxidoreductase
VLEFKDVEKPVPADNEVLVKVRATSVNAAEKLLIRGTPLFVRLMAGGLFKPGNTTPGADMAGVVEAVGKDVRQFKAGDEVFGDLSSTSRGSYAEYVCVAENTLTLKPAKLSFEEAASVPLAGVTALQAIRDKGQLQPGQKVLINGAGGGVGTFAVQIARAFGAEVTATCSTSKVDMVRGLGAHHVVDYTKEDVTRNGQQYDLILDVGLNRMVSDYRRSLTPQGKYVLVGGAINRFFQFMVMAPLLSLFGSQKFTNIMAAPQPKDLEFLAGLIEAGKVVPVIDRSFPLAKAADALRYFETGSVRGKIVISVPQNA